MSPPKDSRPDNYKMNAKICRLVEKCPFMYDRSHPQYLRKEMCDEAWIRIANEMGESVFPCRERWRNIRTSFARSINTNKVPYSANRTKPYYLHEELKFLVRHITPGVPVRNKRRPTSGSGEESELIEVSVGEETFNGFERLSTMGSESTDTTQNGNETSWQRLQQLPPHLNDSESGGGGGGGVGDGGGDTTAGVDNESCNSSVNGGVSHRREDEQSCSSFSRLPLPPLQAAPHSKLQRGNDETEAAAVLQQIHMSNSDTSLRPPLSKWPRKESETTAGDNMAGVDNGSDRHHQTNVDTGFIQELQTELGNMCHRQKIHFKRRIYEALSEIYPLPMGVTETESKAINSSSDATTSQLALAALTRVENLCRNLKCEAIANVSSAIPTKTIIANGHFQRDVESPRIDSSVAGQVRTDVASTSSILPPKRNGMGLRTRSRPNERLKFNTTDNCTAVKDEPESTD